MAICLSWDCNTWKTFFAKQREKTSIRVPLVTTYHRHLATRKSILKYPPIPYTNKRMVYLFKDPLYTAFDCLWNFNDMTKGGFKYCPDVICLLCIWFVQYRNDHLTWTIMGRNLKILSSKSCCTDSCIHLSWYISTSVVPKSNIWQRRYWP